MSDNKRLIPLKNCITGSAKEKRDILAGKEVWRPVPGYKKYYQVSSFGRFKYLDRVYHSKVTKNGKVTDQKRLKKGFIKSKSANARYEKVQLFNSVKTSEWNYIHRLVIEAFFGVTTGRFFMCDHVDNDKSNNNITNLQVVTARYNAVKYTRSMKSSSIYTGVYYRAKYKRYVALISIKGKRVYLKSSTDELVCHRAYQDALMSINSSI